jgi:hypothetical protein
MYIDSIKIQNNTALSYHVYIFFQITFECMPLILNILIFFQITFECVVMDDINTKNASIMQYSIINFRSLWEREKHVITEMWCTLTLSKSKMLFLHWSLKIVENVPFMSSCPLDRFTLYAIFIKWRKQYCSFLSCIYFFPNYIWMYAFNIKYIDFFSDNIWMSCEKEKNML